jgi:hypothetical protein
MQFIGIIELAATGIWDSNFNIFYLIFIFRMDKSIEDFDMAIKLDC